MIIVKALSVEAKEWAAVTFCLGSAVSTYWLATRVGLNVCAPLALSGLLWALVGAWLGNLVSPYSHALWRVQVMRDRIAHVSPLSRLILNGAGALFAAYVLFRTSQSFISPLV